MTNPYFTATGYPATRSAGASAPLRAQLAAIAAAFDKMPELAGKGGKPVFVRSAADGLEAVDSIENTPIGTAQRESGAFTSLLVDGTVRAGDGNVSLPGFAFEDAPGSGMGRADAALFFSIAGTERLKLSPNRLTLKPAAASGVQYSLLINNPYTYGSGAGTAAAGILFTRDDLPTAGSGNDGVMAGIWAGNVFDATSSFGYLAFGTRNGGAQVPTEWMRLDNEGNMIFSLTTAAPALADNNKVVLTHPTTTTARLTVKCSDGVLRAFTMNLT